MTRTPLSVDLAVAVVIAMIVLIASPGTAIDAILALILLVVSGVIALVVRRAQGLAAPALRSPPAVSGPPPPCSPGARCSAAPCWPEPGRCSRRGPPGLRARMRSRAFSRRVGTVDGDSVVLTAARRFASPGAEWAAPGTARVELRVRRRGGPWGPWAPPRLPATTPESPRSGPAPSFGEPLWVGAADQLQLRSRRRRSRRSRALRGQPGPHAGPPPPRLGSPSASALATDAAVHLPLAQPILPAGPGQPPIIARAAWAGAPRPARRPARYGSIKLAFVHHTENPNGYSPGSGAADAAGHLRLPPLRRGFFDIAYNFLIDAFGRIWEGRAGGIDEPVIGRPRGRLQPRVSLASPSSARSSPRPTAAAALAALERLLAWKLSLHGVPVARQGPQSRSIRSVPSTRRSRPEPSPAPARRRSSRRGPDRLPR